MSSNNMYRVGDFVFFEASATTPYQIRRIDELNKTATGAVEAKVTCYFRRRDISNNLIQQAEKYYFQETDSDPEPSDNSNGCLTNIQRHQIKHRELFRSRQVERLPATHIRGKCTVTLYNEVEPLSSYVLREDAFYYRLIYDPSTKRLQEDRSSMRIGSDYQSDIQPRLKSGEKDPRFKQSLEELVWDPRVCPPPSETDLFVGLTKAVGLYARSCDPSSNQPLLLNAAAAAGRDITLQFAHDTLFRAGCDIKKAMSLLVPDGQPTLCRDELESWTAVEAALFEEALEKYSKFFTDILTDFLPWKTPKSIVELYYFWKTTERYIRHRRVKLTAQEHKLKQVYIPNYSKPNAAVLYNKNDANNRDCACCHVETSPQWYAWGPPHLMCRLCSGCWAYWKKYGGLKNPDKRGSTNSSRPSPEQRVQDRIDAARSTQKGSIVVGVHSNAFSNAASNQNTTSVTGVDHRSAPSHHPHQPDVSLSSVMYRCTQSGCVKEFRSRDNLTTHLAQIHNVTLPRSVTTSSGDSQANLMAVADASMVFSGRGLVPGASLGGGVYRAQSGTLCLVTPPELRIVRTLCPQLLRPVLLARRPMKPAYTTAIGKQDLENATGDSNATDYNLLKQLRELAKIEMSKLGTNALNLLHRRKAVSHSLSTIIGGLMKAKGIEVTTDEIADTKHQGRDAEASLNGNLSPLVMNGKADVDAWSPSNGAEDSDAALVVVEEMKSDNDEEIPVVSTDARDDDCSPPPEKKRALDSSNWSNADDYDDDGVASLGGDSDHVANAATNGNHSKPITATAAAGEFNSTS